MTLKSREKQRDWMILIHINHLRIVGRLRRRKVNKIIIEELFFFYFFFRESELEGVI